MRSDGLGWGASLKPSRDGAFHALGWASHRFLHSRPKTSRIACTTYAGRRARLAAHIGPEALALIPTAPQRLRNRDCDFPYRHDSYFYYLTGFAEPDSWLALTGEGQSVLFCQPKDEEREIWTGIRLGPQAAPAALGVDEAHAISELDERLPALLENRRVVSLCRA